MRLMTDDVDVDLFDVTERAEAWETIRMNMKLGATTPENFNWDDRRAVRSFFERLPIVEPVDPRRGLVKIVGEANLIEGRDWGFATTRDGTFGVFSLDEPSRTFLESATLHLWVPDPTNNDPFREERVDFIDLDDYLVAAQDAMQYWLSAPAALAA